MKDNSTLKIKNEIKHECDTRVWWRCVIGAIGGLLVATGFAFAAQQHFSAVETSAENVRMQKELNRLRSEQKRLIFEREMAASPSQLEARARKIGLQNISAEQINGMDEADFHSSENAQTNQNQEKKQKLETAFIKSRKPKAD